MVNHSRETYKKAGFIRKMRSIVLFVNAYTLYAREMTTLLNMSTFLNKSPSKNEIDHLLE